MRYLFWLISTSLIALPAHADFLGDLVSKLTGEDSAAAVSMTSDISPTDTIKPPTAAPKGNQLSRAAHVRILDKRTNRLTDHTFTTDAPWAFDDLTIQVKNCRRHHHQVGHHAAWFTIMDIPHDDTATTANTSNTLTPQVTAEGAPPRFNGWMMSAFPSVAALDHPRYDIRLIECKR